MLSTINYLLDFYQEVIYLDNNLFTLGFQKLVSVNGMSLNLLDVYLYPFIYVFLLVTVLSIVYCLSYNKDELVTFMFYCKVILVAGYFLFFTAYDEYLHNDLLYLGITSLHQHSTLAAATVILTSTT